jgi:bifunctional DNase/RNase
MKSRILGALALILSATGHAQAGDRMAAAMFFREVSKSSCGFKMTPESAIKAATILGMSDPIHEPVLSAVFAVCEAVKKGKKGKTIEIRAPDKHKVMRKVILEKAEWWQA